jgi:hypothetical protein
LWVLCVVKYRSLQRTDRSSRRVLPSVVCLSVTAKPRNGKPWLWIGSKRHRKKKYIYICIQYTSCLWQVSILAVQVQHTCNSVKKVRIYGRNQSDLCVINARHVGNSWWWNLCVSCGHSYGNKHTTVYTIIQCVQQCMYTDNNTCESEKMCLSMQQNSPVPESRIFTAVTA